MAQANQAAGKPLGAMARAFAAMRGQYTTNNGTMTVVGASTQTWPSALQPVQPIAPKGSKPLAFSYWQGVNQSITPRLDAPLSFAELRDLAGYPLARICIENVKDVICSMKWKIQLKRTQGESTKDWKARQQKDKIGPQLTTFFERPDGEHQWSDWIRPILEDMMVIDAPSVLVERTIAGKVALLRWTDGADILKLIDDRGFTPAEGWAYTQLWEGIPRIGLSRRDLIYHPSNIVPRNNVASKLYGMSITEQVAPEIRIGQERLRFVLAYYTEGSVPGVIQVIPAGTSPDIIQEGQQWMNSELSGNLAKRRQYRYVPGYQSDPEKEDQIIQLKEPILADAFDEVHIRRIAFAYGSDSQRLLKAMNRASAEAGQDAAEKQGTMPRVAWLKSFMDGTLIEQFDISTHEWLPETDDELDAEKQAIVDKGNISIGLETIDERREARGLIPFGLPETSQPIIITATGVQPIEGSIDRVNQQMQNDTIAAKKPTPAPGGAASQSSEKKTLKSVKIFIDTDKLTPHNEKMREGFEHRLARWFKRSAKSAAVALDDHFAGVTAKVAKSGDESEDDDTQVELLAGGAKLPKIESDAIRAAALLAWRSMKWSLLADEMQAYLSDAAQDGMTVAIDDANPTTAEQDAANTEAVNYGKARSAEMVGMVRDANGKLVEEPDAHWPISIPTLTDLEKTIAQGVEEGWTLNQLAAVIEASYTFSPKRAELVAENEMMNAQTAGTVAVWKNLDVTTIVRWRVNDLAPRAPDECDEYEAQGNVPLGHEFAEGLFSPRAHPKCRCRLEVIRDGSQ